MCGDSEMVNDSKYGGNLWDEVHGLHFGGPWLTQAKKNRALSSQLTLEGCTLLEYLRYDLGIFG